MPETKYLNISINNSPADVASIEEFPIAINYRLEEAEDFQKKSSADAFNVKLPATLANRKIANSFHDISTDDTSLNQEYRSHQPAIIEADGVPLLVGKAFLNNATHTANPVEYEFNFYGGNADWLIDLKEKTLYDFLHNINFLYGVLNIVNSWGYDGRNEDIPYVFAPVRYRGAMDVENNNNENMSVSYLRPSLSKYWLIYWAFKSVGYRIQSKFFDTDYFRRQVMPWTWGSFLTSEGTKLDVHKFKVKSAGERFINSDFEDWLDLGVRIEAAEGMFDANNEYSYTSPDMMWEYKTPDNGALEAHFEMTVSTQGNVVGDKSFFDYYVHFSHNGVEYEVQPILLVSGRNLANTEINSIRTIRTFRTVVLGDKITARLRLKIHEGGGIGARVNFHSKVDEYKLAYFKTTFGGSINFANYIGFKKYKFLDFFSGVVDEYNLSFSTDSINKVVHIEPTHSYEADGFVMPGFFNGDVVDWQDKVDLSEEWQLDLFSDYEREVLFKYRNDNNDGGLKVVQDRNQNTLAAGKYVFPERFKAGKKEHENRFFAPTMHVDIDEFKAVTGIAPQMVAIVPENISNTSSGEAENTFLPKSCYYKGVVMGAGGWKFGGELLTYYPFMFAVNYKAGGHLDPVLSYSDERIGNEVARGLMKKFYGQRLAIMRNGQFYQAAHLNLKNVDVNRFHVEHKLIGGERFELVQINNYRPLKNVSTECMLRRHAWITEADYNNSYPSNDSVTNPEAALLEHDIKYAPLLCLTTDIPK